MIGLLLLLLSAGLLLAGTELFIDNAVGTARGLRLSVLAVGLLLAGAEPEELLTGVLASAAHHPGLAAGDALGANVTMLTATLGLAALARPLPVGRRVRDYAVLSAVAGLAAVLVLLDGRVSRAEGGMLLAAYAGLVAAIWWREHGPPQLGEAHEGVGAAGAAERRPLPALLRAVFGLALMTAGGSAAVAGATRAVATLHADDTAVGLTLLALATTAELFALVWAAARRGVPEVAVAGVVGSAAYNATATLGAAALTRPLAVSGLVPAAGLAASLPLLVVVLSRGSGRLGRPAGAALCAIYALYVTLAFR